MSVIVPSITRFDEQPKNKSSVSEQGNIAADPAKVFEVEKAQQVYKHPHSFFRVILK